MNTHLGVTNHGPHDALNVRIENPLPSGYAVLSADGSGSYDPATGFWTVGTLADQAGVTMQIKTTVRHTSSNGRRRSGIRPSGPAARFSMARTPV